MGAARLFMLRVELGRGVICRDRPHVHHSGVSVWRGCWVAPSGFDDWHGWGGWQTLFVYLLLDDSLRIHERFGKSLAEFLHFSPLAGLRARDIGELLISAFFGSLIMGLLSLGYYDACRRLRRISRHLLGLFIILVFFGVIFDAMHQMIGPSMRHMAEIFEVIEDGGEMVTISLLAWYVHRLTTGWSCHFPRWYIRKPSIRM
jgi:hypothetical protein